MVQRSFRLRFSARTAHLWVVAVVVSVSSALSATAAVADPSVVRVAAPVMNGDGAALGVGLPAMGRIAPQVVRYDSRLGAVTADGVQLGSADVDWAPWFNAARRLVALAGSSRIAAGRDLESAQRRLERAEEAESAARAAGLRLTLGVGYAGGTDMLRATVMLDAVSGAVPVTSAVRTLESIDQLVSTAEKRILLAAAARERASFEAAEAASRFARLSDELAAAQEIAGHLLAVHAVTAGTELHRSALPALAFSVAAPRQPQVLPEPSSAGIAASFPVPIGFTYAPVGSVGLGGLAAPGVALFDVGQALVFSEALSPNDVEFAAQLQSSKLAAFSDVLASARTVSFPVFSLRVDGVTVTAVAVDGSDASVLDALGIASLGKDHVVLSSAAQLTLGSLLGSKIQARVVSAQRLTHGGVAWNAPRLRAQFLAESAKKADAKKADAKKAAAKKADAKKADAKKADAKRAKTEKAAGGVEGAAANPQQQSSIGFTVTGVADLPVGVGAVVDRAYVEELLYSQSAPYTLVLAAPGDQNRSALTWAARAALSTVASGPSSGLLLRAAAPPPSAYLTAGAAADVLGVLPYRVVGDPQLSDTIEVPAGFLDTFISAQNQPLIGATTCGRFVAHQLAGALAEAAVRGVAARLGAEGYAGCSSQRLIRGGSSPSFHTWGLAVDLDAAENALETEGRMDPSAVAVFKSWGWRWGGDWSRLDPMHFEASALLDPLWSAGKKR